MKRSSLKNFLNKQRTHKNYRMQRSLCDDLQRKTKNKYFTNLNIKNIADSKTFWKTNKPNSNEKGSRCSKMIL